MADDSRQAGSASGLKRLLAQLKKGEEPDAALQTDLTLFLEQALKEAARVMEDAVEAGVSEDQARRLVMAGSHAGMLQMARNLLDLAAETHKLDAALKERETASVLQ